MHELLSKPWEIFSATTLYMNNNMLLCIVDYYNKFPVMKRAGGLLADNLIKAAKIMFAVFGLPKIILDEGTNFISEQFEQFCR